MSSAILLPEEPPGGSALMESGIVDAPPDRELDTIVQVASLVCEAPIALVAWHDETWLRFKAQVGLGSVS